MNAVLVINHFLKSEKYNALHSHLVKTAGEMNIDLKVKTNLELATEKIQSDFVLFWDKDINLAKRLELEGHRVFNSADSIELCVDKAKTYLALLDTVKQPKTLIAPKCYFKSDMSEFAEKAAAVLGLPLVFKECYGSFGEQVYLCRTIDEILSHVTEKPFILQKFESSNAGKDIRIEVVGNTCVSAAMRENQNDFRSNVTNGGTMTPYKPTEKEIATAVSACKKLGLTFGGVDIFLNGKVCEVNSNAHIINIMNTNSIDIAPFIFKEITEKIL